MLTEEAISEVMSEVRLESGWNYGVLGHNRAISFNHLPKFNVDQNWSKEEFRERLFKYLTGPTASASLIRLEPAIRSIRDILQLILSDGLRQKVESARESNEAISLSITKEKGAMLFEQIEVLNQSILVLHRQCYTEDEVKK